MIDCKAFIRGGGKSAAPFSLKIFEPQPDGEGTFFCRIDCPLIQSFEFKIYGINEEHACEQAVIFVADFLCDGDVELIDAQGKAIDIAKMLNTWIIQQTP